MPCMTIIKKPVESTTRMYRGQVVSGRTAERRGEVRQDWMQTEQFAKDTRVSQSLVPSRASLTRRLNVSPNARTSEILCKPMEEHNDRLTSGLCPVYVRFITGTRIALCSWLLTSEPAPFLFL